MTLIDFLKWASTSPGVSAIVNFAVGLGESLAVDWVPGFAELAPRVKRLVVMVLSFMVPIGALLLLVAVGEASFTLEELWSVLTAGFGAYFGSQLAHAAHLEA